MEDKYVHTLDGQEFNEADVNLIAAEAALADDHVFSELLRLAPSADGVTVGAKAILAASTPEIAGSGQSALMVPSGSANATVYISPFRAFVMMPAAQAIDAYKNLRSALCMSALAVTAGAAGGPFGQALQFSAATNNRWDLVCVRIDVDIDGPTVQRFIKTGTTPAALTSIAVTKKTVATLVVIAGTEATTPARPATPADSGSSYYIPLAYVLLLAGHTLTTAIAKANIAEIAPIVHIHRATGAASLRIANGAYGITGYAEANEHWTVAAGRPNGYLAPTMGGKTELVFGLRQSATPRTATLNSITVIDDSLDWRNRVFKVTCALKAVSSEMAWRATGNVNKFPDGRSSNGSTLRNSVAQSFQEDSASTGKAVLMVLDDTTGSAQLATGSSMTLYVDLTDGKLKVTLNNTAPACDFVFWVEATGQFNNAF